jgi:hypothetical protein
MKKRAAPKIHPPKTPPKEKAPGRLAVVHELLLSSLPVEERLAGPEELAAWLRRHGLHPDGLAVDEDAWRDVLRLRDDLLALVRVQHGEPCPPEVLQRLNETPDRHVRVRIRPNARLSETPVDVPGGWAGVRYQLLEIVHTAIRERQWSRFRFCDSEHCHWLFYDVTNNYRGRWCRKLCGNREIQRKRRKKRI